jgi:hypothetical protein
VIETLVFNVVWIIFIRRVREEKRNVEGRRDVRWDGSIKGRVG